MQKIGGAVD